MRLGIFEIIDPNLPPHWRYTISSSLYIRGRVNREVQTVNWETGKEGAVETGVKSS